MFEYLGRRFSVTTNGRPNARSWMALLAMLALLSASPASSQAVCTWNQNGPGLWAVASNWNNCSGGNGNPIGTPGSADHAVIGNSAPLADVDLGSAARAVDRLTLSRGRIFGDADITVVTRLNWTGGQIDGGNVATLLILDSASNSDIAGDLHVLSRRGLRVVGALTWTAGNIELQQDAEIDNQGQLTIDYSEVVPLELYGDFSPLARLHNSATPGAQIEKISSGMVRFDGGVTFDNGNNVLVNGGTLQVAGPGTDFGDYQIAASARLEFGTEFAVNRELTGSAAVAGSGTLHKLGEGTLSITGGYALTGPIEVVNGVLQIDSAVDPLSLPTLRVAGDGVFSSPDNLQITGTLDWQGGEIIGSGGALSLTLPAAAVATVSLNDVNSSAYLRSRDLINQGTFLISGTGGASVKTFFLDNASIDNQGDFELRANNQNNVILNCIATDCGSFFNRAGATLRLNDFQGLAVIESLLTTLNNDGLVELVNGCGQINSPGVDTGTYRYNSNCTLAFFTRPGSERVFEASVVLDQVGLAGLQVGGSLRINGPARSFGDLFIDSSATLFGPAALTFTGSTEWRGLIEGSSTSETVTVAPGATLQSNGDPLDAPLLVARTLFNNGDFTLHVPLTLDGNAEIRNSSQLNLLGSPLAAGGIVCATPPLCGLVTNTSTGTILSTSLFPGPNAQLGTDVSVVNQGALLIGTGVLVLDSSFSAAAGSVVDVGPGTGLRRTVGNLQLAAGNLRGAGVIEANLDTDLVDIQPAGATAGNLTVLGNFSATVNTTYDMGIAGTAPPALVRLGEAGAPRGSAMSYDRLTISGSAALNGTLNVINLGYAASGSDAFDLLRYASRTGTVLAGANPYSGVGLNLQVEATRLRLAAAAGGGCEWNPAGLGADDWTNPLKWNNCGSGVGPGPGPLGTPGAPDIAIIGGGVVNLDVPVAVSELQFTGGTIMGANNLAIDNDLTWTGGRFQGASSNTVTVNAGASVTLAGGQHSIDGRTFQLNSTANWTTGLIELANGGVLELGSTGVLNSNPNLSLERIFASGSGTAELRNAGAINKLGPNSAGIAQNVQYSGMGSINVNAGTFIFAASSLSALSGSYAAVAGSNLHFVGGNRSFGASASLSGGTLVFGDSNLVASINTVNTCIAAGSSVVIRNAELLLNCAGPTDLAALQISEALAVLEGSSAISVSSNFVWSHGSIRGTGLAQTFEIAPGAVALLNAPLGPLLPRTLSNRRLRNFGTINWTASNATEVNNLAQFANESGGQLNLSGNGARDVTSNTPNAALLTNNGTLRVLAGAQANVDIDFDNSGTVQILDGQLRLRRGGADIGSYNVAAGSSLYFDGAVRAMSASASVSGSGEVRVIGGAALVTDGSFTPHSLFIDVGTLQIDAAAPQLIQTLFLRSGTLTGNSEIRIGSSFDWLNGGVLASVGASPGPVVIQSGGLMAMCGGLCTLSNRVLRIEGNADWSGGVVEVPMGESGKISVPVGGSLQTTSVKTTARYRCAALPCSVEMEIAGSLRQLGDGANFSLSAPLQLNGGLLQIGGGGLTVPALTVASGSVEIDSNGDLNANPLILNGGVLRGNGNVNGDVNNVAGLIQPGASPGQINIFGNYTQGLSGALDIEVDGLSPGFNSDFLVVSGSASLDGTLNVIDAGFSLTAPASLDFLDTSAGISGNFAVTNIAYPGYIVDYGSFTAALVPAALPLVVNSAGDAGDGICDLSECTLREALIAANLLPDPDVIEFAIQAPQCTGPGGICVIMPSSALPTISGALLIDGYSQPGAVRNTQAPSLGLGSDAVLKIELNGSATPAAPGLTINAPSTAVIIAGLAIYGSNRGILTQGPGDSNYQVIGNFLGLRADGSVAPGSQLAGLSIQGGNTLVGNATAAGMNVISGNAQQGISIQSIPALASLQVVGNLIGTAANGVTALGNGLQGIAANTSTAIAGIFIGGNDPDERNVISGNLQDGIRLHCTAVSGNCFDGAQVIGNFIGPAANGSPLGNVGNGVNLSAMNDGLVRIGNMGAGTGNRIAFNGGNGILATYALGRASFLRNDIYLNGQQGIDLGGDGRTANDVGDVDTGPNGRLNFPVFSAYSAPGGNSAVIEVLINTPNAGNYPVRVDFYKAVEDEPGVWLGTTSCAAPNVSCPASFAFPGGVTVTPGDVVLGIVTDGFGKSSEASFYASSTLITAVAPEPSPIGTPYTVTVEVSSSAPFAPIGAVAIDDGTGNSCTATLSAVSSGLSSGSCALPSLAPAGVRTLTAQYVFSTPPPQPFTSSNTSLAHTITAAAPVITLISPSSGPTTGGTLVTVSGSNFEVGSTAIDFGPNPGVATSCISTVQCTVSSPAGSGTVNVRATTSAGSSADTAADDFSYGVTATSTLISDISPLSTVVGQPYTVTVSVIAGVSAVTTGTVQVRQLSDGTLCSINLAGANSCQLVANSAITTAVRATFLGSPAFAPSVSTISPHVVNRAATAIEIVSDTPDPSVAGLPITVTTVLAVLAPGAGTPTGQILITDGSASCGITLPNLACVLTPKALGAATLEARYLGDANFDSSVDTEAHIFTADGADLAIIKRNGLRLLPGGAASTYVLLVTNAGPQAVVNARVTDILPAQFTAASWTCTASIGASCPTSGIGNVDALVNLDVGASLSFALTATVQRAPEQVVSNRATVTPPVNAPDPQMQNNESVDIDPIGIFGAGFETDDE